MIWSVNSAELRRSEQLLRTEKPKRLQDTGALAQDFAERGIPFDPVNYLEIPPIAHKIGKLVIPYVSIGPQGRLNQNVPYFYAVTVRPDIAGFDSPAAARRSQQSHITAEDMSLKRGIFTPYARVNTEVLVASMVTNVYRDNYIQDRVAHLEELVSEATTGEHLYPKQSDIVVEELTLAIGALQSRIS